MVCATGRPGNYDPTISLDRHAKILYGNKSLVVKTDGQGNMAEKDKCLRYSI